MLPLYSCSLPKIHFLVYSLHEGGAPPRFLIIDDGWQETVDEFKEVDETLREQTVLVFHSWVTHSKCAPALFPDLRCNYARFAQRLTDLKENHKFRGETCKNLGDLVKKIKEKHGVK